VSRADKNPKTAKTPGVFCRFFRFYLKYGGKGFTIILGENWTILYFCSPKIN